MKMYRIAQKIWDALCQLYSTCAYIMQWSNRKKQQQKIKSLQRPVGST